MGLTSKGAVTRTLALLLPTLLAACGGSNIPSPSTSFPTSNIYVYMKAVQDVSGNVSTTVQLRDGAASTAGYLYVAGGETLYTSLDISPQQYLNFNGNLFDNGLALSEHLKVMAPRDLFTDFILFTQVIFGKPEYISFDTPSTGSSPVRAYVDFERTGNVMAGESSIDLPPAFQILAPAGGASVSRATPLVLTWTNVDPTTTMRLDVAGVCTDGSRYTLQPISGITDTGSATLNSADYFPATGISPSINCQVAFILQRVRTGGVSPNFAFGSFEGVQQRTVQFTTTP